MLLEVGLHSIWLGGAMAMFLAGVATLIIQWVGRWESDAFMEYIREQVESFTTGVSSKIITNVTNFDLGILLLNYMYLTTVYPINETANIFLFNKTVIIICSSSLKIC